MDFRDRGSDLGIEMVEFRTTVPVEWNAYAADAVKIGHRVADVPRTASMKGGEYSPPNRSRKLPAVTSGFECGCERSLCRRAREALDSVVKVRFRPVLLGCERCPGIEA